jgi:hypothetical protein
MIEWNIQSRGHVCQGCHRHFADHESFHTLLFDQKQCYERLDVCDACWRAQYSQGATDRKGFVSYWQGLYEVPPVAAAEPIQKENAETLLRKLIEVRDPAHAGALFILAVMLERKRLFKVKAQLNENGQRAFVYEHAKSGDLFTIPDPNLRLDQLQEVQRDVGQLLERGLPTGETVMANGAAPAETSPTPPTAVALEIPAVSAETSSDQGPTPANC